MSAPPKTLQQLEATAKSFIDTSDTSSLTAIAHEIIFTGYPASNKPASTSSAAPSTPKSSGGWLSGLSNAVQSVSKYIPGLGKADETELTMRHLLEYAILADQAKCVETLLAVIAAPEHAALKINEAALGKALVDRLHSLITDKNLTCILALRCLQRLQVQSTVCKTLLKCAVETSSSCTNIPKCKLCSVFTGGSLLACAAAHDAKDLCGVLVECGADVTERVNKKGTGLLAIADGDGQHELIELPNSDVTRQWFLEQMKKVAPENYQYHDIMLDINAFQMEAPTTLAPTRANEKCYLLSIDGGGLRGLIPARVVSMFEKRTGLPASVLFQGIAGTSTGSIIAAGLNTSDQMGALYSAEKLCQLYLERGAAIFGDARGKFTLNSSHSRLTLDTILNQYFGNHMLSGVKNDVLIPAFEMRTNRMVVFSSRLARENPKCDLPLRLVVAASSAAPTVFDPVRPQYGRLVLVDGGVCVNDPSMLLVADAIKRGYRLENITLLSIGTGTSDTSHSGATSKLYWAQRIFAVANKGSSDTCDYVLRALLGERYIRMQTESEVPLDGGKNIAASLGLLEQQAQVLIRRETGRIDALSDLLKANAISREQQGIAFTK